MTTTMMMDRMTMPGTMTNQSMASGMPTMPQMMPNMVMVPRCSMKIVKCEGGIKIMAMCDDPTACTMMQNLCTMMAGGMCSLCCMMNGMMVCCCNLTMGACKLEMMNNGCCLTCTSGDDNCCAMIQSCGDCLMTCMESGCCCCMMIGGTPVCCCMC
ncbi:hypothetical protein [Tuwongella immobilis]|uniref:Uncharacterized protein n=1 Tax=Tuwongella immobilis TaxID=692036 RepID=A0A6C2YL34_9BACT|nr:hypothetical protein [Tuwongella immobilis]VIP02288.1 Uncharacterized protein OS=Singulisphaera acidiphila (strain ATCC BAA-1392 / DSM 18658 / VKM B-2454 / MOB10) GN=Sinac_7186 PE=4 SV=1 [Tuwongella immobilis]VTS00950.1 Uncharacterized protein OS=Singulisphaera acidiphila (strain ATCC BAA-1392 / DSM 18658 / VKM B-2454 / MOB10) GN=Sinac_7186 PE=4 SV=1 [Tuwongella immobilis]